MLQIDRIRLRLPAGYAHRATGIARLVGEYLGAEAAAGFPLSPEGRGGQRAPSLNIAALTVSLVPTNPHASDSEIARLAVAQLRDSLRSNS